MTPFEGTSTCIETARPLQLLEVLSSACALVFLSSRSLTSLQTSGGPLTSSRITPDSLLPFVHPPPLSSTRSRFTPATVHPKPRLSPTTVYTKLRFTPDPLSHNMPAIISCCCLLVTNHGLLFICCCFCLVFFCDRCCCCCCCLVGTRGGHQTTMVVIF